MIFKWIFMVFIMRLNQAYVNRLNQEWKDYLENKFYNPSKGKHIELNIHFSDEGLDWKMAGVKYNSGFRINGDGGLRVFIKLKFEEDERIKNRIEKSAFSGNVIGKSRFLSRPLERIITTSNYSVECKVKRVPDKKKCLFNNVFGYLMRGPMDVIHSKSRL